ncbi:MAG: DUF6351 family protein [Pseudomonadota bacterium]
MRRFIKAFPPAFFLALATMVLLLGCDNKNNEETRINVAEVVINDEPIVNLIISPDLGQLRVPVKLKNVNTISLSIIGGIKAPEDALGADQATPLQSYWGPKYYAWSGQVRVTETFTVDNLDVSPAMALGYLVLQDMGGYLSARIDAETGSSDAQFSGPRQYPFLCRTEDAGLGQPLVDNQNGEGIVIYKLDENGQKTQEVAGYCKDCNMAGRVDYFYRATDGTFKKLTTTVGEVGRLPSDLTQTTTSDGLTVDYIVRVERGTINRFIYALAMLAPNYTQDATGLNWDVSAWNKKLLYKFQGGVGIGHQQGNSWATEMVNENKRLSNGGPLFHDALSQGYAVAFSTGNVTDTHYNLQLCAETAMMVKDHFVARYGRPIYTASVGGSGGSIQQYHLAQEHPGVLDGIIPEYSYSDMITQSIYVGDCSLLEYYFDAVAPGQGDTTFGGINLQNFTKIGSVLPRTWIEGLNAADDMAHPIYSQVNPQYTGSTECVNGWLGLTPLVMNPLWTNVEGLDALPPETVAAVKWTHWNDLANIYGVDAQGYAPFTWDNVGVQYGLGALKDGLITVNQFLDINAQIGGWKLPRDMIQEGYPFYGTLAPDYSNFDPWSIRNSTIAQKDANGVSPRTEGDQAAINKAFTSGMVYVGKNSNIPIIDTRNYLEPQLNMHHVQQSFATRKRLGAERGAADNMLVWFYGPGYNYIPHALDVMDQWLTNMSAQTVPDPVTAKPAAAVDRCADAQGVLIAEGTGVWNGIIDALPNGACTQAYPLFSTSRIVAGGGIEGDVFKCQLMSVDEAVQAGLYDGVNLTQANLDRLKEIFPTGVCDYTQADAARPSSL